jgi:hypothetical protein
MYRKRRSHSPVRRRSGSYGRRRSPIKRKSPYKWKYVQHPFHPHHDGWVLYKKKKTYSPSRRSPHHYHKKVTYKPKGYLPYYFDNPPDARTAAKLLKAIMNGNTSNPIVVLSSPTSPSVSALPIFTPQAPVQTTTQFPQNAAGTTKAITVIKSNTESVPLLETMKALTNVKWTKTNNSPPSQADPGKIYVYLFKDRYEESIVQLLKTNALNRFILIQAIPHDGVSLPIQIPADLQGKVFKLYYNPSVNPPQWYEPSQLQDNQAAVNQIKHLSTSATV